LTFLRFFALFGCASEPATERFSFDGELLLRVLAEAASLLRSVSLEVVISLEGAPLGFRATSVMCGGSGPVPFLGEPQINTSYCTLCGTETGNALAAVGLLCVLQRSL
jgi:hypothetical protein